MLLNHKYFSKGLAGLQGQFWKGMKRVAPIGIRPLDRLARSQSLYRLRTKAHNAPLTQYDWQQYVLPSKAALSQQSFRMVACMVTETRQRLIKLHID